MRQMIYHSTPHAIEKHIGGSCYPQGGKLSGMISISKLVSLEIKTDEILEIMDHTSASDLEEGSNFRFNALYIRVQYSKYRDIQWTAHG